MAWIGCRFRGGTSHKRDLSLLIQGLLYKVSPGLVTKA